MSLLLFLPPPHPTPPPPFSLNSKDPEAKSQWKLCFKLYCLLDTESISVDSIEYLFLFEQVMKQNPDVRVSAERSGRGRTHDGTSLIFFFCSDSFIAFH